MRLIFIGSLMIVFINILQISSFLSERIFDSQNHSQIRYSLRNRASDFFQEKKFNQYNCQDPNERELENHLAKAYSEYMNLMMNGIEYMVDVQHAYKDLIQTPSAHQSIVRTYGNTKCAISSQTHWQLEGYSSCPYHFVEVKRLDRFPFWQKQAVCNCQNCLRYNAVELRLDCMQINIVKLVLKRGECVNGIYQWRPCFENVPISCTCMRNVILD
jgi:hypothetical protein